MNRSEMQLVTESGQMRKLRLADATPDQTLADFLDAKGFPLNTRCGGRGICKGCLVEVDDQPFRACQIEPADIADCQKLRIPELSRHDHSLYGVSLFEVRVPMPASQQDGIGLALDIGTTTVAGALWDLATGQCLAHACRANAQSRFGDNVLSRISFAIESENGESQLQKTLVQDSLKPLLNELCEATELTADQITRCSAAGNPIMLHTLAGASLAGFARYPFRPEFLDEQVVHSEQLGFSGAFPVDLLPSAGPFVGADIAAGAVAVGLHEIDAPVLFIDFGTNGEILLCHQEGRLATATAAGPAFEGGRLNCGQIVRPGVITGLEWYEEGWQCLIQDNQTPACGLSGSAYIDFLAIGLANGWLNEFGRFDRQHPVVQPRGDAADQEWAIELIDGIYITEVDVAELLQAKAAIGGGVLSLLEEADLEMKDLDSVFVAGGFGYHLDPAHAISIGLLPNIPVEKVEIIGNASLGGASLCLHDVHSDNLNRFAQGCRTVELNQISTFEEHFTDALLLQKLQKFC